MKISIITITARADGRFQDMATSLIASLALADPSVSLEWILVDEIKRSMGDLELHIAHSIGDNQQTDNRFDFKRVEAPHLATGLPTHNSARNLGLAQVTGEYVVFLYDRTLITSRWVSLAAEIAKQGKGWKCRTVPLVDVHMGKPLTVGVVGERAWRSAPAKSIEGCACWGAPTDAFVNVDGFDQSYDGEQHCHDSEAAIRLERMGVSFVYSTRAVALRIKKGAVPVTSDRAARESRANRRRFAALARSGATLPEKGFGAAHEGSSPARAQVVAPPAPKAAQEKPAPKKPRGGGRKKDKRPAEDAVDAAAARAAEAHVALEKEEKELEKELGLDNDDMELGLDDDIDDIEDAAAAAGGEA